KLGTVKIGGSVLGGSADEAGTIEGHLAIGSVSIGGNLLGGAGKYSGSIYTGGAVAGNDDGAIGSITIGGSLIAGTHALTGIISDSTIGTIKITGDVRGTASATAKIIAEGILVPAVQSQALAIKNLTVGGSVTFAEVLAGYGIDENAT